MSGKIIETGGEMAFAEMMHSFVGRRIEEVIIAEDNREVLLHLDDDTSMAVGKDEENGLYIIKYRKDHRQGVH